MKKIIQGKSILIIPDPNQPKPKQYAAINVVLKTDQEKTAQAINTLMYNSLTGNEAPVLVAELPGSSPLKFAIQKMEAARRKKLEQVHKAAQKAPAWAKGIVQAGEIQQRFHQCLEATMTFAKTTDRRVESSVAGYNLYHRRKLILRQRHLWVIIDHLKAQHIWKEFICS